MDKNLKVSLIIGGMLLAILFVFPLIAGVVTGWETCEYNMKEYGMMGPWMMGEFGMGWWMPIIWIVIIGLIAWVVITLTRRAGSTNSQDSNKPISALEILKERYARGEIGKEEYEDKKKDLTQVVHE